MLDIVNMLNGIFSCPKCHRVWPDNSAFWNHVTLPMGNNNLFIAAVCRACTDSHPNRQQASEHKTILRSDSTGTVISVLYNLSLSGWIPPTPKELLYDYSNTTL